MFKAGDLVAYKEGTLPPTSHQVLEVDLSGNIRISPEYPPKFLSKDRFELYTSSDSARSLLEAVERIKGGALSATGIKHDSGKPDMSLLSNVALLKVAEVMTFGKKKYAAHNWRGGFVWSRPLAAAMRHLMAYIGGEDKDPETGLSHLAHCACCIMFVLEFEDTKPELDDRYKGAVNGTQTDKK